MTRIFYFCTDDLSFQKVALQSSTRYEPLHKASYAVDRRTTTWARMDVIGHSSPDKTVWWKVDLGGVYSIYSINVLFKNYDGNGMLFCILPKIVSQ